MAQSQPFERETFLCAGMPWIKLPGWGLPETEVQALATAIRRAARLLWALHLTFQEGFDKVCASHSASACAKPLIALSARSDLLGRCLLDRSACSTLLPGEHTQLCARWEPEGRRSSATGASSAARSSSTPRRCCSSCGVGV